MAPTPNIKSLYILNHKKADIELRPNSIAKKY